MKKSGMKASSLKKVLIALLVMIVLASVAGFYYGLQILQAYAVEVSHTVADADASGKSVQKLQELKKSLAERETLVAKADKIFATESNYQSQALTDVQRYAAQAGLTISNTNFDAPADGGLVSTNRSFVITLQSPVSYSKFLQFLNSIEGNLPKMQVSSINLSRAAGGVDDVTTGEIKLTISVR